jgi:predicted nucleic acid-binding protein
VEPQSPKDVVVDTSVLINFLNVDRLDLFASHPQYRFLVTEHVKREVTEHYPQQINRLNVGLAFVMTLQTSCHDWGACLLLLDKGLEWRINSLPSVTSR